jgi:hypothetical protein
MRLDRSLGDVQIFSDFRIVTSLKKQIDDLPFPGSYVVELLFHKHHTSPIRPGGCKWLSNQVLGISGFGSLRPILHSHGQIGLRPLTKYENFCDAGFSLDNGGYYRNCRHMCAASFTHCLG